MKKLVLSFVAMALFASAFSFAAAKTYQVTGPVLEVTDSMIAVQKGKDRWEIDRSAGTKVTGDLKVGSKVTVEYTMNAKSIEGKADAKAAKTDAKPATKAESKPAAKPAK